MSGLGGLRSEVRAFLAADRAAGGFTPICDAWMQGHDPAFSRRLAERGWIGMTWPARYGGGERSALERHAVTEELLAAGAPVAAHWFADRQVGPGLMRFGSEEQRRRFLPRIARGECFFSIGMSESGAGSDLAAVETVARPVDGGWRVTGTKVWTSHALQSHYMLTLCRTEARGENRHEGLSQIVIDLGATGVDVRPIVGIDGIAHFAEVILDDVPVAAEDLLGERGGGWKQVTSELAYERSGAERFFSTLPLVGATVEAVGPTPGDADAERLGRAYASLFALRRLSLDVVEQLDLGVAPELEAALVKDLGTCFEQELVEQLRLVDAPGDERRAELLRQAQLAAPGFTVRGGTTEILRGIIGRGVAAA